MLWSKALSVLSAEFGLRALKKNAAVVTAESCTAGGIANAIAATPGASAWLKGGWVTYQTSQKIDWLGVPEELIASEGVVSEAVAEAMARGALARTPTASHAVATTGVAGPSGGTDDTPVGTVCIAWADRRAGHIVTVSRRIRVPGSREDVTEGAVQVPPPFGRVPSVEDSSARRSPMLRGAYRKSRRGHEAGNAGRSRRSSQWYRPT